VIGATVSCGTRSRTMSRTSSSLMSRASSPPRSTDLQALHRSGSSSCTRWQTKLMSPPRSRYWWTRPASRFRKSIKRRRAGPRPPGTFSRQLCGPNSCGTGDDGCGNTITCSGTCGNGKICTNNQCKVCVPSTCQNISVCGPVPNGCGAFSNASHANLARCATRMGSAWESAVRTVSSASNASSAEATATSRQREIVASSSEELGDLASPPRAAPASLSASQRSLKAIAVWDRVHPIWSRWTGQIPANRRIAVRQGVRRPFSKTPNYQRLIRRNRTVDFRRRGGLMIAAYLAAACRFDPRIGWTALQTVMVGGDES
jgi:hypothetical protein